MIKTIEFEVLKVADIEYRRKCTSRVVVAHVDVFLDFASSSKNGFATLMTK